MSNSASGRGTSNSKPRYKECMKNHAVGIGGHSLDGCGDFMPAGAEGTLDALKCAACNCHRNFHRKETTSESATQLQTHPQPSPPGTGGAIFFCHHRSVPQFTPYDRTPAGYLHVAEARPGGPPPPQRPLALSLTSHSREDQEGMSNPSGGGGGGGSSRKRSRTKFTAEQKERMLALAETLGWRIHKNHEAVVQEFCNETGVRRHVLKVWMHNNKHTLGKKP